MTVQPQQWLAAVSPATTVDSGQYDARVVQLENGNYVVSWTSDSPNGVGNQPGAEVIARIFDPLGNSVSQELRINKAYSAHDEEAAEIVALNDGGFLVVYKDIDGADTALRMDRFDANGNDVPSPASILGADDPDLNYAVSASGSDSVMVAYEDGAAIKARIYFPTADSFGNELTIAQASGGPITNIELTALKNGNYAMTAVYTNNTGPVIVTKVMTFTGVTVSSLSFTGNTNVNGRLDTDPNIVALEDGGFATVWRSADGPDRTIFVQRHSETGSEIGQPIDVNQGGGTGFDGLDPVLASTLDGGFVVVFVSPTANAIMARAFNANGNAVGDFMTVADDPTARDPRVETLEDGRVVVTWTMSGGGDDVASAIIDPRAGGVAAYGGPTTYEMYIGTVGRDIAGTSEAKELHMHDGDDLIVFDGLAASNQLVHGGKGYDALKLISNEFFDMKDVSFKSMEAIEFSDNPTGSATVYFASHQFGQGGIASDLHVDGSVVGSSAVEVNMDSPGLFSLKNWTFKDWNSGEDHVRVLSSFGDDTIRGSGQDDVLRLYGGDDRALGYEGNDHLRGYDGDDTLIGSKGNDYLSGGEDEDRLDGGLGADSLFGGDGEDAIKAGVGDDTAYGGDGNDNIFAHDGNDFVHGESGHDVIYGGKGYDTILGGFGNDTLRGGNQNDLVGGDEGNDNIEGGNGKDTLDGGSGSDKLFGGDGNDQVFGGGGQDTLIGGDHHDQLDGGADKDRLVGGAGRDTLIGGEDADLLIGGGDKDVFGFEKAADSTTATYDTISDFLRGSDLIDLSAIDANQNVFGDQDFTFIGDAQFTGAGQVRAVQDGDGMRVLARVDDTGSADMRIDLDGLFGAMSADDFIL